MNSSNEKHSDWGVSEDELRRPLPLGGLSSTVAPKGAEAHLTEPRYLWEAVPVYLGALQLALAQEDDAEVTRLTTAVGDLCEIKLGQRPTDEFLQESATGIGTYEPEL
jgi:hypothetical protein